MFTSSHARAQLASLFLAGALGAAPVRADDAPDPLLSAAIFLHQPTLTGNWGGTRDELAKRGVSFDLSLTQFYQGAAVGGALPGYQYGGKADFYLHLDGTQGGWLNGFAFVTHVETRYGEDVNNTDGFLTFGDFNMAFPAADTSTGVTSFKLTQKIGDNLMLIAGKINTLDDFRLNFTGHNGRDRFMNSAIVANIINARTIPYSTYGGGFAVFAEKGPEFTLLVRDPDDHATTTDLDKLFANGVLLTGSLRIPVTPLGLPGTHVVGGNWSSRRYTSIDPSSWANIPGQGVPAPSEYGSWAVYYNFDQVLWQDPDNPQRRFGLFGMTGVSDGNPNSISWNVTLGLGGSGLVPGREHDSFGAGLFYINLSDNFKDFIVRPPEPPGLAQQAERGVELYYNAALTPWCNLTFDVQIVEPSTRALDTTIVFGIRLGISF